jgi:hypothetical protein
MITESREFYICFSDNFQKFFSLSKLNFLPFIVNIFSIILSSLNRPEFTCRNANAALYACFLINNMLFFKAPLIAPTGHFLAQAVQPIHLS